MRVGPVWNEVSCTPVAVAHFAGDQALVNGLWLPIVQLRHLSVVTPFQSSRECVVACDKVSMSDAPDEKSLTTFVITRW